MMKKALYTSILLVISLFAYHKAHANGCTGSNFSIQYNTCCDCWEMCGNFISDCDRIKSLSWNMGDGTTYSGSNPPCHTYSQPGTYTVTMTVVAYCHAHFFYTITTTCHITRQAVQTGITTLAAGFNIDTVCLGDNLVFNNTSQSPGTAPGNITSYYWDFGDGTTSSAANPNHVFDSCGVFDVTLIVENRGGCTNYSIWDTITKKVHVNCPPLAEPNDDGLVDPYIQQSSATLRMNEVCEGGPTSHILTPTGPISNWQFTFPDGSTSLSRNPLYTYPGCQGAQTQVVVELTTDRGCREVIDTNASVLCKPDLATTADSTLCFGDCNGTATVNISNGQPPYSVTWSDPSAQTAATAMNLCAGFYGVTVADSNGCVETASVNVYEPLLFTGTTSILTPIDCYGWNTGSAILAMTGGTMPYSYFWSTGATTDTVTGLTAGIYQVTSTDANGCMFNTSVTLTEPPELGGTFNITPASCGLCDGSATISPTGGKGTYSYMWSNGQTGQTAIGFCAGVNSVLITDAGVSGCSKNLFFTVNSANAATISVSSTDATCSSLCDGSVVASINGGCPNAPCSYSWLDSTGVAIGQSAASAINLCAGSYTIEVTDAGGCKSYATTTVGVLSPVILNTSSTINTCLPCNGTATVTASGGSGNFTYQWADSSGNIAAGQTASVLPNLCAGLYRVTATDQSGCFETETIRVYQNVVKASATGKNVLCYGACQGTITVAASGGITPYVYTFADGGGNIVASGPNSIAANLCAGTYNISVSDSTGCTISLPPVTITQPPQLMAATSTVLPSCFGECDGIVSIVPAGGTPPYTYEWKDFFSNPLPGGNLPAVDSLCAGQYFVQVMDSYNCALPFLPVNLLQPDSFIYSFDVIPPYCSGGSGSINLNFTGGTPPYTFSWNNGQFNTQNISGVVPGLYTVSVTDANNCSFTDSVEIPQVTPIVTSITKRLYLGQYHTRCNNDSVGGVVLTVSGGWPPYTYQWNDPGSSTTDSIYGLPLGSYRVTVTDSAGCSVVDTVTLNLSPPPFFLSQTKTDVTCPGYNNGTIDLVPSGGIPSYYAFWEHDSTLHDMQLDSLPPGIYVASVFDTVGCMRSDTIEIFEPDTLHAVFNVLNVDCKDNSTGEIDLTVTGGTLPYQYSWNNGAFSTEDLTGLPDGWYTIEITDSNNCYLRDSVEVTEPAGLITDITAADVSCYNENDGSVTLTVSGGTGPYSFSWNNGIYTTQNLQLLTDGTYSVEVTDDQGCVVYDTAVIYEPAFPADSQDVEICAGTSFLAGGAYQTSPGTYYDTLSAASGCDSAVITTLDTVNRFYTNVSDTVCFGEAYSVGWYDHSIQGIYYDTLIAVGGCDSVVILDLTVWDPIGLYTVPDTSVINPGGSVTVDVLHTSLSDIAQYVWSPSAGLSCTDCSSPLVQPTESTDYMVIATDDRGCIDTASFVLIIDTIDERDIIIYVPNAFTPNGDGVNDDFRIFGKGFLSYELTIFDRWGELLYKTNDQDLGWDGTYKGELMNPGAYVYYVEITFINELVPQDYKKYQKGSFTLMR